MPNKVKVDKKIYKSLEEARHKLNPKENSRTVHGRFKRGLPIKVSLGLVKFKKKDREEISFRGNLNLFFGKKTAPNFDINFIISPIFLLFKEWSPLIFTSILGVVDNTPISSLARVPELQKSNSVFFFA